MLSLELALVLRAAGLAWKPALHDFFVVPNSELEGRLFVISDLMADVEQVVSGQTIAFNGAVEWSLDTIMLSEVVWMPTEAQLREHLQASLLAEEQPAVILASFNDGYHCQISHQGGVHRFEGVEASEAYGLALLFLLGQELGGRAADGELSA
ncbi:MAG: pilus assembly protein CpaE [Candidatus Promineifilaceae bacterium]